MGVKTKPEILVVPIFLCGIDWCRPIASPHKNVNSFESKDCRDIQFLKQHRFFLYYHHLCHRLCHRTFVRLYDDDATALYSILLLLLSMEVHYTHTQKPDRTNNILPVYELVHSVFSNIDEEFI